MNCPSLYRLSNFLSFVPPRYLRYFDVAISANFHARTSQVRRSSSTCIEISFIVEIGLNRILRVISWVMFSSPPASLNKSYWCEVSRPHTPPSGISKSPEYMIPSFSLFTFNVTHNFHLNCVTVLGKL